MLVGIYGVAAKQDLIKTIIGLILMEYAVVLFFYSYQLVAIAIITTGLASTILITAIAMRLYERYGTFDIKEMRKLKG